MKRGVGAATRKKAHKTQAVPLSITETRSQRTWESGKEGQDIEGRLEVALRNPVARSEWK